MRILVVDDAYATRNLIRRCVQQSGYPAPVEAKSMEEGLDLLEAEMPDLVILDLKLEDGKSFRFIEAFKKQTAGLTRPPVLFGLNGSNHPEISEQAIEAGVRLVVRKPFQPRFLTDRIDELQEELCRAADTAPAESFTESPSSSAVPEAEQTPSLTEANMPIETVEPLEVHPDVEKMPGPVPDQAFTVRSTPAEKPAAFHLKTDRDQIDFPNRHYPEREPIVAFVDDEPAEKPPDDPDLHYSVSGSREDSSDQLNPPASVTEEIRNRPPEVPAEDIRGWRPRIRPPAAGLPEEPVRELPPATGFDDKSMFLINEDTTDDELPEEEKKSLVSLFKGLFKKT